MTNMGLAGKAAIGMLGAFLLLAAIQVSMASYRRTHPHETVRLVLPPDGVLMFNGTQTVQSKTPVKLYEFVGCPHTYFYGHEKDTHYDELIVIYSDGTSERLDRTYDQSDIDKLQLPQALFWQAEIITADCGVLVKSALDRAKAKVKRLRDELRETRAEQSAWRSNAADVLAKHYANERRLDRVVSANAFELQELKDKCAVQAIMLAQAQSDAAESIARLNRQLQYRHDDRALIDTLQAHVDLLQSDLTEAQQAFGYRAWVVLARHCDRLSCAITGGYVRRRDRLKNWLAIRRLSRARVEAMTEADYIPGRLVRAAIRYWEHDKARLEHDEEIVYSQTHASDYTHYSRPPGLWRRVKILLGRA